MWYLISIVYFKGKNINTVKPVFTKHHISIILKYFLQIIYLNLNFTKEGGFQSDIFNFELARSY